jgi:sarcosine oxidase
MNVFDTIVLGLGAMGSAAVCQLARRGRRVLGIDQFSPPHTLGSTHGDTRVTRLAIGEGAHYTPLALRSHAIWHALERETGADLLTTNGVLIISSGARTAFTHVENFFANTCAAAQQFGIAHEIMDGPEIRRRFPQFNVRDDEVGYVEPGAGFVRPEACVRTQLALARQHGATLHCGERVTTFDATASGVRVTTDHAVYAAENLIVAAGPWLLPFLPPTFARHFRVYRQALFWFDIDGDVAPYEAPRFPVFIWELQGRDQGVYGFPALDGPGGGMKIATEEYRATTTPETVERGVGPAETATTFERYVGPYLPGVSRRCLRATTCLYTVTPDFGFVIDRHPEFRNVIVASPCSGHGFKHSAAIGEVLADLATGSPSQFELGAFALARFAEDRNGGG